MRFAYLSTDEVNQALASEMATECGILFHLAPKDGPPDGSYDAVVCDWDNWPAAQRQEFLNLLADGPAARPVAVHGYNVSDRLKKALLNCGALVVTNLQEQVFQFLSLGTTVLPTAEPSTEGSS
jgi:hypothetical protein